jgi:hypothetical protein
VLIIPIMLLGIGVALFRRSANAVAEGPRGDAPMRLLQWATSLLSARRSEWGQAMLGELDHIEGRGRRWRFTIGCVSAALLLSPWGRAGAGAFAMVALAIGGLGVYASVIIRYRLGTNSLVGAAIVATFLLSFVLAAMVSLRRPGIAVPGLLSGLFVAVIWLAMSGFTFLNLIARTWSAWAVPLLFIVVPGVVGVVGTLRGGSAVAGRRTARLAGISAGLGVYLYGTLAVAVIGAGGPPDDNLTTVSSIVDDRLSNNLIFYLALLPLLTITLGWAAAASTARICHLPQHAAATYSPPYVPATPSHRALPRTAAPIWQRRSARVSVISFGVAGMLALAFATGVRG